MMDIKNYLKDMSFKPLRDSQLAQSPQLTQKSYQNKRNNNLNENTALVAQNISFIKEKNIEMLQQIINPNPISIKNEKVYDYLKRQDLRRFLGVKRKGNFLDIFHDEDNPSASIYLSEKGNRHQLYKCFSTSRPFSYSIFEIVANLLSCTDIEAKKFLQAVLKYPNIYKVFNRHGYLLDWCQLLELAKEYAIEDEGGVRATFFHGIRKIAKLFNRSSSATGIRINFFILFIIIKNLMMLKFLVIY